MPTKTRRHAQLTVPISAELKRVIEDAAAALGQSVDEFAVSSLVQTARGVMQQQAVTKLSDRDREVFVGLLDDARVKPNKALRLAAARYKAHLDQTK